MIGKCFFLARTLRGHLAMPPQGERMRKNQGPVCGGCFLSTELQSKNVHPACPSKPWRSRKRESKDLERGIIKMMQLFLCAFIQAGAVFSFCSMRAIDLSVKISDANGHKIEEVRQGVPFLLTVSVSGDKQNLGEPRIDHLEKVDNVERMPVTTSIMLLNGRQQVKKNYVYRLRIDSIGNYVLGPAYYDQGNYLVKSDAVSFFVAKYNSNAEGEASDPFVFVSTNNNQAYIGEQILLTVQLCFRKELSQFSLEQFKSQAFTTTQLYKPVNEKIAYDGRQWSSVRYTFALYAKKPGAIIVPALHAQCEREKEFVAGGLMAHFSSWFGNDTEIVKVQSQPLELSIRPLPVVNKKSIGVGHVEDFSISVDKQQIEQSKGITATLSLTGNLNSNDSLFGKLVVPKAFRAYESKVAIDLTDTAGIFTKKQEWILQALQPGKITIPSQEITYFDTTINQYKTLKTQPVVCTVKSLALPSLPVTPEHKKNVIRFEERVPQPLSLLSLLLFILVPIFCIIFHYFIRLYRIPLQRMRRYRKMYAMIKASQRKDERVLLYEAWVLLFTESLGIDITKKQLKNVGMLFLHGETEQTKWFYYVAAMEKYVFEDLSVRDIGLLLKLDARMDSTSSPRAGRKKTVHPERESKGYPELVGGCERKNEFQKSSVDKLYRDTLLWLKRFRTVV